MITDYSEKTKRIIKQLETELSEDIMEDIKELLAIYTLDEIKIIEKALNKLTS